MIYTITPSVSIDYFMQVDQLTVGQLNRATSQWVKAGGKGINVSRVLNRFDLPTKALGFTFGPCGLFLQELLEHEDFPYQMYHSEVENTRINVKALAASTTEINGASCTIQKEQYDALTKDLSKIKEDDLVVISGKMDQEFLDYCKNTLLPYLQKKNIKFILDTDDKSLSSLLSYHPYLIKPNLEEFESLCNHQFETVDEIIPYARKLQEKGAINIMITLGSNGGVFVDENNEVYIQKGIPVICANPVGAGDASIAGFIYGYQSSHNYKSAFRFAMTTGATSCWKNANFTKEDVIYLSQTF